MKRQDSLAFRLAARKGVLGIIASCVIAVSPFSASAGLYAVTDAGTVFESSNDGVTWSAKGQIAEPRVVSLSPGLTTGILFALGETGSLYQSTDAGTTWISVGSAGASDFAALAIARGGALLALTQSGDLFRSTDNGTTWVTASTVGASDCVALAVGGKAGPVDTLFAITASGDVAISSTGASWTSIGTTGHTPAVDLLWIAQTLYAMTDAGEILNSSNNGVTWSAIGTISQVGMGDLAFTGGKFKTISKEGEVYESANGSSWSPSWIGTTNQVFTVAFAPGTPEFMTGIESPAPPGLLALRAWPNPFTARVEFRFDRSIGFAGRTDDADDTAVEIFDLAGRRVARAIARKEADWSGFSASWDGRLGDGRPATSGIYLARAKTAAFSETTPIILLR